MSESTPISVRPELVEGLSFFSALPKEGRGFDRLSQNGVGLTCRTEDAL